VTKAHHRPTIAECRARLSAAESAMLPDLIAELAGDDRAGVQDVVAVARRRVAAAHAETSRLQALTRHQVALHATGAVVVAGLDEVGRGAIAGPVTAGAVVMTVDLLIEGLDDSKRVPRHRRPALAKVIRDRCSAWAVEHVPAGRIDEVGIEAATRQAMGAALARLGVGVDHALVDGRVDGLDVPSTSVVRGDSLVACIAAASVIAKVQRDALMDLLDAEYPGYGLAVNKGYCTADHLEALRTLGPSAIHRLTWAPLAEGRQSSLF
jgi:ribonuclease HII